MSTRCATSGLTARETCA